MSKYKIDIMNLVSEAEGLALKLFCRAINSSNADVYIIMAHKAVRLFEVLLEQGYIDPCVGEKLIISHEALDFNCRSLFQKKLVIVDDIMISGTSISSVVNRLVSMGIDQKQIQIITLATDKDYFVMQFDNEAGEDALTCHTEFDDAECIALTATISECFNAYGIPYDVDFPEYAMFEMQDNDLSLFFKEHLWDVKRVDNNPAISTASEGYTFFLRDSFLAELWETLGVDLSKCAALKIRAYIEHLPNNLNRVRCISMCLFRGITTEWLDKLYNLFMPDGHSLSLAPDNEVIAKMRYVQFYVAHRLFEAFLKSISMQNETLIIKGSVHLLFGEQDGETVYDILTHPEPVHREITAIDMTEYDVKCLLKDNDLDSFNNMVKQIQDRGVEITEHDHEINSALTLPFIWWYDQKEIPVRKHIKEIRPHYVRDWEMIRTLLTRLSHGFPMVVLLDIFRDILEDYNVELLLSLFIDRAVDKGIIVPTIYYDRDHKFVSRAYRHGEDLPFALADQCRLVYFIDCLRKAIPAFDGGLEKRGEGIAATSLEKMIVLFYQMGLRKKTVFNRFLGFNNIKLIKPFLSVHGKINAFVDPKDLKKVHIFSEKDENGEEYIVWLTKWLWKKKILISNHEKEEQARVFYVDGRNVHEFLKNNERSCIRDSIKDSIRSIAGMLSTWYDEMATNEGKDAFKEDAIILSSCADPATYASAIATEIHYFSKFWKKQCQETMQAVHSYRRLFDEFAPKSDNYLQSRNTGTALHSGRNKVRWFNAGKATEVKERVRNLLQDKKVFGLSEYLDSIDTIKLSSYPELQDLVNKAIGYLYFYSSCYICFHSLDFWDNCVLPEKFDKYRKEYESLCQTTPLLDNRLFQALENVCQTEEFDKKKEEFDALVQSVLNDSEAVVEKIEDQITSVADDFTVTYTSSLIVDIEPLYMDDADKIVMAVWNSLPEDKSKTQLNIVKFPGRDLPEKMTRYGFFYEYEKDAVDHYLDNGKKLIDVFNLICREFNAKVYSIRAILLPETPQIISFRHNVEQNLVKTAEKFEENVVMPILPSYNDNAIKQLAVVLEARVPKDELLNYIETMKWEVQPDKKRECDRFKDVRLFCNRTRRSKHKVINSIVHVQCGGKSGMGVLVRLKDRIVCISCNHNFLNADKSEMTALITNCDEIVFSLREFKKIDLNAPEKFLQAANELAVLIPDWEGNIPLDVHSLLSLEDFDDNEQDSFNQLCTCYGGKDANTCRWSDEFIIRGPAYGNYMQTEIDPKGNRPVESGYSGGVVRRVNVDSKIVGIHEGRIGESRGKVIPASVIKEEIRKLLNEEHGN